MPAAHFPDLAPEPLSVEFDTPAASSEGGAALLAALDEKLAYTAAVVACLSDHRDASRVFYPLLALFRQRVYLLALGYFDCNDSQRLRDDPLLRLLLGQDPQDGPGLASQPTLSRFENSINAEQLDRMERAFAQAVIDSQRQRRGSAHFIYIDFDPTCDPTHGQQQLALFNGFYETWCFLPLVGFVSFDNEAEQWLVAARLRGGCAPAKEGFLEILEWLLPMLRKAYPKARLRMRLDSGFQGGELLSYLRAAGVQVVLSLQGNKVLKRMAQPCAQRAQEQWDRYQKELQAYEEAVKAWPEEVQRAQEEGRRKPRLPRPPQRPGPCFGQVLYKAGPWERRWRVVIKAEWAEQAGRKPKLNLRYVLTDVGGSPRRIYERLYCPRGDAENRLKELKAGLGMDRTSCHKFEANRLRVLLAGLAYALMQALRWEARGTCLARAQVPRLQGCLLKLAAWVRRGAGAWRVHLPERAPWREEWLTVAGRLGAVAAP